MRYQERERLNNRRSNHMRRPSRKWGKYILCIILIFLVLLFLSIPINDNIRYNSFIDIVDSMDVEKTEDYYKKHVEGNNRVKKRVEETVAKKFLELEVMFESKKIEFKEASKIAEFYVSLPFLNDKSVETQKRITALYKKNAETKLNATYNSYLAEDISYAEAKGVLDSMKAESVLPDSFEKDSSNIETLNSSRISYSEAVDDAKNKLYLEAVNKFKKVKKIDPNYKDAQNQIKKMKSGYRTELINQINELGKKEQYSEAMEAINGGLSILKDDAELKSLKTMYRKKEIEKMKNDQLVKVSKATITEQHPTDKKEHPDMLTAVVTNYSDKTLVYYEVGFFAFDRNGKIIKLRTVTKGSKQQYLIAGVVDKIKVGSGKEYGKGYGWEIYEDKNIKEIKACVIKAKFSDKTEWKNPFYDFWKKTYMPK